MFAKNKVSQSMIDAVNKVLGEQPVEQEDVLLNEAGAPIKEPTSTGMRVYGRSYGNSAKAKQDQSKSSVDDLKGPKTKELMQKDKEDYMKTKGKYDEAAKPDFLDFDKDGDKKEPMKKALGDKKKVAEELKGDQHKIDANKNNKIDAHDFAILRGKKKVKEDMYFAKKLIEGMKRSDIPAFVRKARGDAPLTPAEVKSGSKDSISDPKNLAKARNEEIEIDEASCETEVKKHEKRMHGKNGEVAKHVDKMHKEEIESLDEVSLKTATSAYVKRVGRDETGADPKAAKTIQHIANRYGVKGVARAAKIADMEYGLNDPVHNKRKDFVKSVMSGVKEEVESLDEKNVPTSPEKWAKAKAAAKSKFAVYPSAYANGWASKKYKAMGGGWKSVSEEIEQEELIDEKAGYSAKAARAGKDIGKPGKAFSMIAKKAGERYGSSEAGKRVAGAILAKLRKEDEDWSDEDIDALFEVHELEERKMTDAEMKKREDIVKGMKKGLAGFKSRYGARAKDVMYATATKQAMKEASEDSAPITTDTLAGRMPGGKSNDFKSYKLRVRPLDKEGEKEPKDATPEIIQPDETPARKSHEVKEATIAGTSGWKKMPSTVTDKSGAQHSPMSRARNLAQQAFKKVQDKTKVKSEMMLGKDGGTSESKKL